MANKRYSNFHRARKYYRKFQHALRYPHIEKAMRLHDLFYTYAHDTIINDGHRLEAIYQRSGYKL